MNNFEAKHPRARDGKFTEKQNKEAGVTLFEGSKYAHLDTPEGCERGNITTEFAGKTPKRPNEDEFDNNVDCFEAFTEWERERCAAAGPGDWVVTDHSRYGHIDHYEFHTRDGMVIEEHENGKLTFQSFVEPTYNPIRDSNRWSVKLWYKNGNLLKQEKEIYPRNEKDVPPLIQAVSKHGGSLTFLETYREDGSMEAEFSFFTKDGELYCRSVDFTKDGEVASQTEEAVHC